MQSRQLGGIAQANRRLVSGQGNRTNLDGMEPVVLEDTGARQDESASALSLGHSNGDLLTSILEKQLIVPRNEPANQNVATAEGACRLMVSLIERTPLRKERVDR